MSDPTCPCLQVMSEGKMGVHRAALIALEHNVSRTTLKDRRIAGSIIHWNNIGPKPHLTDGEEKELVKFLVDCSMGRQMKIVEVTMKKKERMAIFLKDGPWWHFHEPCHFHE